MKERFRQIPIELITSPAYENITADAQHVLHSLIVSSRQTRPGIYDGGMKDLENETALSAERLNATLKELEQAHMIEPVLPVGWWVVDIFQWQCCDRDYAEVARRHLSVRWPAYLLKFQKKHESTLGKYIKQERDISPQRENTPPSHPSQASTNSELWETHILKYWHPSAVEKYFRSQEEMRNPVAVVEEPDQPDNTISGPDPGSKEIRNRCPNSFVEGDDTSRTDGGPSAEGDTCGRGKAQSATISLPYEQLHIPVAIKQRSEGLVGSTPRRPNGNTKGGKI